MSLKVLVEEDLGILITTELFKKLDSGWAIMLLNRLVNTLSTEQVRLHNTSMKF